MVTMVVNAYWAFGQFMMTSAATAQDAAFWGKALFLWPFLVALMLHFTLAFTESDLLKHRLTHVMLYVPPLVFSLTDLLTDWVSLPPISTSWGFAPSTSYNILARLDGVWSAVLGLTLLILYANYYNQVTDKTAKHQTKFVAIGFGISIVISLITDSIFPVLGIDFPVLGPISGSATAIFVVYAMLRYDLFVFRPEIAFENVFSTMPDSTLLLNLDGHVVRVNRAFVELSGFSEAEIVGQPIADLITKGRIVTEDGVAPKIISRLRTEREIKNYEISFCAKTGERVVGTLSCSMVSNNRGADVGAAFIFHDLRERKKIEQKLLKAERFASIGELAGILGHDLRNPLMGIRGAAYYLKTKHSQSWDSEDVIMFESINKSIDYSNKIVTDLIEYSSEIMLDLKPITPKSLMAEALSSMVLPERIEVIDETLDAPEFRVDIAKMRRAFGNLIKNSYDAMMPFGGTLKIASEISGNHIIFTLKDTGDGMSEETLARIWSPLFTTKAKGMGFGLAICKRTVEAHNGKIWVESIVKIGTTVHIKLPLDLQPYPESQMK